MAPGTKVKVAALVSTAAVTHHRMSVREFKPVGGSGLRGLGFVIKGGGKIRVHATLACAKSCPAAHGRFRFAEGRCGESTGKSFTLKAGKLGPGGLDFHREVAITPDNDLNEGIVKYEWDFNVKSGRYDPAACAGRTRIPATPKSSIVAALAPLEPVGGSGLRGLGFAHKDGDKLRFHATLACSQACPADTAANGVPVRFRFTEGSCGKPTGKSFALKGGKLGPGGLDVHGARSFDPDNDPLTFWNAMRSGWDLNNDGEFGSAACAPETESYHYVDGGWFYGGNG